MMTPLFKAKENVSQCCWDIFYKLKVE